MTELSNEPMNPDNGPEMSIVDTWIAAFTKPSEGTFAKIISQPGVSVSKAFLWVFVASILTTFASLVSRALSFGRQLGGLQQFLPPEFATEIPISTGPSVGFFTVICGTPIGAIVAVLFFAIFTGLVQWIAKLFGGTGSFEKLAYAFSAIIVPYSAISAVLVLVGIIPFVGILTGIVNFGLSIYVFVLEVLAIRAVNGISTGKSVGSILLPGLIPLFLACCAIGVLLLLGPSIGEIFSEINQGLGTY